MSGITKPSLWTMIITSITVLVGEDYIAKGFSSFTAEQNIRYLKECLKGEKLTPRFRMLNVNKKSITLYARFLKSQMKWPPG